jgi:hypothetical protein
MTSRRSSGSSRADSAVEPTRSQNITVSCRRSASAGVGIARCGRRRGGGHFGVEGGDAVEQPSAMPDQIDAEILQIFGR